MENFELLKLLTDRLYHENNLFAQRTNHYLTSNAFFVAALALVFNLAKSQASISAESYFQYLIVLLGIGFAIIQIVLGKINERSMTFFRTYLHITELLTGYKLDSAVLGFMQNREIETSVGIIRTKNNNTARNMNNTSLPFKPRSFVLHIIGVLHPFIFFNFWLVVLNVLLIRDGFTKSSIVLSILFTLLAAFMIFYPLPKPEKLTLACTGRQSPSE